jgi:autotransporter-associated beta strand protein
VNAGALKLNAGSSTLLTVGGTGTITVNSGASLFISRNSGTFNLTKAIAINAGGSLSVGGNLANGSYDIASPIAWSGATTLNTNTGSANEAINFTGAWTGTGTITTSSTGSGTGRAIVLSGDNSGLAAHIVNVQTIAVGTDKALGTGVYRADANSVLRSADTNTRTINNVVDLASNTTFGSAGTGDLIFTATATQVGSNGNNNTGIATGNGAKTITVNNARSTISGIITDSGAATANALTKAGPGILVFSGANTYNRPTVITAGTLQVTGGGRIGSPTNNRTVTVQDNGLLQLDVAGLSDAGTLDVTSTDATAEVAIGTGVNDTVSGLIVNGVPMAPGVYGSTASGAANPGLANPDDVFSGAGTLTVTSLAVVPEPGALGLAAVVLGGAFTGRRRRRQARPA